MHDILTPRERFGLLLIDEKPDRCNAIPLITSHAAKIKGMCGESPYTLIARTSAPIRKTTGRRATPRRIGSRSW